MSEHTPGPWALNKDGNVTVSDGTVLRAHGVAFGVTSTPESKANARLIAAAPDLLEVARIAAEALRIASDWNMDEFQIGDEMVDTDDLINRVDAAIAKATGGEE